MRGVNKVILVGNLGKDPEVQHLEGGTVLARFPLATSDSYKDKGTGNRVEQTEWHNIVAWRNLAEFCGKYLHKGSAVYIEGKIRTRSWTDKDNNKKYMTEIIADTISMLDRRTDNADANTTVSSTTVETADSTPADDLPF